LVNFYQTTRCYNPEDSNLHTHRRENLKSYLGKILGAAPSPLCRLPHADSSQDVWRLHLINATDFRQDSVQKSNKGRSIVLLMGSEALTEVKCGLGSSGLRRSCQRFEKSIASIFSVDLMECDAV
jgi:hypothetical protein